LKAENENVKMDELFKLWFLTVTVQTVVYMR